MRRPPLPRPCLPPRGAAATAAATATGPARGTRSGRGSGTALAPVLAALVAAALAPPAGAQDAGPSAWSDALRVMEADGRSFVLQHTVAAEGATLVLRLPGSVVPDRVTFLGPGRDRWARRHARRPERVSIGSGGALVRYRHQYGEEVVETGDGRFALTVRSVPESLSVAADGGAVPAFEAVSAWVFPAGVEVDSWAVAGAEPGDGDGTAGSWRFEDGVLTWTQTGLAAVTLELGYRSVAVPGPAAPAGADGAAPAAAMPASEDEGPAFAGGASESSDRDAANAGDDDPDAPAPASAAAPDTDADGVPDARDVCLREPADGPGDGLGCPAADPLVLASVGFPTGRTRLDLPARRALDRLAAALGASGGDWEIAAHTDGVGPESRNLALSLRRAESVRHYLMLRGVAPNRLVARGYGEAEPVADDATAEGRAANRRVELRRLAPDGAPVAGGGVGEDPPDGDGDGDGDGEDGGGEG